MLVCNFADVLLGSGWCVHAFIHPGVHFRAVCEAIKEGHEVGVLGKLWQSYNVGIFGTESCVFSMYISNLHSRSLLLGACFLSLPHVNQVIHCQDVGFCVVKHFSCQGAFFDLVCFKTSRRVSHSVQLILSHFIIVHLQFLLRIRRSDRNRLAS